MQVICQLLKLDSLPRNAGAVEEFRGTAIRKGVQFQGTFITILGAITRHATTRYCLRNPAYPVVYTSLKLLNRRRPRC